jgi:hypothetical protein
MPQLDIPETIGNMPTRAPARVRGRISVPMAVNAGSLIIRAMGEALRKLMETLLGLFRRERETTYVSEERHFKKNFVLYVSKMTSEGTIELWGHSAKGREAMMFGIVKNGRFVKSSTFYHLPYGIQKHAELLSRIVIEGWKRPYRLAEFEARSYR